MTEQIPNEKNKIKYEFRIIFKTKDIEPIPTISKEDLFRIIDGDLQIKEQALKEMLDDGEVYESKAGLFRWLE